MALLDTLLGFGSFGLGIAAFLAACLSYAVFASARRASAALAGIAGGLVLGTFVGAGLPAVAGAVLGGVGGFLAADRHPRGGTVAVAVGAGLSVGLLLGVAVAGSVAFGAVLPLGVACAVGLAALGWRFPRTVVLPGLSVVIGTVAFVGPSLAPRHVGALSAGVLLGPAPLAADQAPYLLAGPLGLLLFGVAIQPFAVEYTDRVPPLLPASIRGLFGATDAGSGVPEESRPPCPDCGTIRDPGHDECHACGAATDADYALPDGVVAVDAPCPICEERPIEELARSYQVSGFLIAYSLRTDRHVGCHDCVRSECWGAAKTTAVTGWWSVSCVVLNPFLIVANLARGLYEQGPTRSLLGVLDESGIEYDLLEDADAFDPADHDDEGLVVEGLVRLGAAVMLADGNPSRAEAMRLTEVLSELSDEHDADEIQRLIKRAGKDEPDLDAVLEGLAGTLTVEGRQVALELAVEVAEADDEVTAAEEAAIAAIESGLDLDDPESVAVEQYVNPTA